MRTLTAVVLVTLIGAGYAAAQDGDGTMPPNAERFLQGKVPANLPSKRAPTPQAIAKNFEHLTSNSDLAAEMADNEPRQYSRIEMEERRAALLDRYANKTGRALSHKETLDIVTFRDKIKAEQKIGRDVDDTESSRILWWALGCTLFGIAGFVYVRRR